MKRAERPPGPTAIATFGTQRQAILGQADGMNTGAANLDALLLQHTNKKEREILDA